jgi:hypothetical protein
LVAGGEDLATALDAEPSPEVLYLPKLLVHLAAKAAGVRSFGLLRTVADYGDLAAVEKSANEARALGFDGASCVHPERGTRPEPRLLAVGGGARPCAPPRRCGRRCEDAREGAFASRARWSMSRW